MIADPLQFVQSNTVANNNNSAIAAAASVVGGVANDVVFLVDMAFDFILRGRGGGGLRLVANQLHQIKIKNSTAIAAATTHI